MQWDRRPNCATNLPGRAEPWPHAPSLVRFFCLPACSGGWGSTSTSSDTDSIEGEVTRRGKATASGCRAPMAGSRRRVGSRTGWKSRVAGSQPQGDQLPPPPGATLNTRSAPSQTLTSIVSLLFPAYLFHCLWADGCGSKLATIRRELTRSSCASINL